MDRFACRISNKFYISVDGTDCRIYEPEPFDTKWYSHKFNGPGLRYEIGVCIVSGNIDALKRNIHTWIPVASPASAQHEASELAPAKGWPIQAVYGNRDPMGPRTSNVWKEVANAKVVELEVSSIIAFR